MDEFMQAAIDEARQGLAEGGIPIGSVLVIDGQIVGRGHNRRVQKDSAILHAEMDCLENAGRLTARDYQRAVLYSTLSPCDMCSQNPQGGHRRKPHVSGTGRLRALARGRAGDPGRP